MRGLRGGLAVFVIAALLVSGVLRTWVQGRHDQLVPRPLATSRLTAFNSFTLGLLLGGLRGPLVMYLWCSVENQKILKNLEDIDTKIELVRMLQPEFDSVHIFQIWNKAYNLSVMQANLQNKYATILDALDYARKVDQERPDNINILVSIGEVYLNKLGSPVATPIERRYLAERLQKETLPRPVQTEAARSRPGWRRTVHDTLLDEKGLLLAAYLAPRPGLESLAARGYDGADLQFLRDYNTPQAGGFPYGVHPLALAYNYYKRAAVLQALTGRKHMYMSESVIDSRSAVALRMWAEAEWETGRRLECEAFGKPLPEERMDLEHITASVRPEQGFPDRSEASVRKVNQAIFSYRRAVDAARHCEQEYIRHIRDRNYSEDAQMYFSQVDNAVAMGSLLAGDRDFLGAMAMQAGFDPPLPARQQSTALLASAADAYRKAIDAYYLMILKYYVRPDVAARVYPEVLGKDLDQNSIERADPAQYPRLHAAVKAYIARNNIPDEYRPDVMEYEGYIARAVLRLGALGTGKAPAATNPG